MKRKHPKFTAAFFKARALLKRARAEHEALSERLGIALSNGTSESVVARIVASKDMSKAIHNTRADEYDRIAKPIWSAMHERFASANGKATSFTLDEYAALSRVEAAEAELEKRGVPLKDRAGCEVTEESAGPQASAYKYDAVGTRFTLRRDASGGWELIDVTRIIVGPKKRARVSYRITSAAGQAIVRRALEDMEIIDNVSEAKAA
jgi:hypothetical protein